MSASPIIASAFEAWMRAELAAHHAAPCPEDEMGRLVDYSGDCFDALMVTPVENADDMLLKVFPLIMRDMEAKRGEPPLRPGVSGSYSYDPSFYENLIADLGKVSPELLFAMAQPAKAGSADNG